MVRNRDYYLDNTKFFLITMVIWGHVLSNLCEGKLCHGVDSFFYVFHMPLFIFISGYFTKVNDSSKFWKATCGLFETLIIFDVIHVIIRIAAGKIIVGDGNFWRIFCCPQWSLWYLLSLISWRIIAYYVSKTKISPTYWLILSITMGLCVGFIPISREFSFQRTFFFLPFFTLGYVCRLVKFNFKILEKIPIYIAACVLMLALICTLYFDYQFKSLLMGCHTYYKYDSPFTQQLVIRFATYLCCFITSVCVLRCIPQYRIKWVSDQGANTIYYFLYHTIVIYFLMALSSYFKWQTPLTISIFYVIVIILTIWVFQKVRIFRLLPNIISFYRKRL